MEDVDRDSQFYLDDFLDGNPRSLNPSVRRRRRKKHLIANAKHHLKECFRLLLESVDRNSIEWSRFRAFFNRVLNEVLKELEAEGVCYVKELPSGKVRIFKRVYCCETVEDWKECPEYRCPIWPCEQGSECPYHPREHEPIEAIEVTHQEPEQGRYQPVESV